jgi:hypothetical protein
LNAAACSQLAQSSFIQSLPADGKLSIRSRIRMAPFQSWGGPFWANRGQYRRAHNSARKGHCRAFPGEIAGSSVRRRGGSLEGPWLAFLANARPVDTSGWDGSSCATRSHAGELFDFKEDEDVTPNLAACPKPATNPRIESNGHKTIMKSNGYTNSIWGS